MILPLSLVGLFGLLALMLLVSPWPYLAPGAVAALGGLLVLYRRPAWGLLAIIALVPFEGLFKDSDLTAAKLLGAGLLLVLGLQLASGQIRGERLRSNLWPLLLAFMAWYGMSFWASENTLVSAGHLREMVIALMLFVITLLVGRELNLLWLARLVSVSVAITCAMAMFSGKYQDQGRASGLLDDPNVFALLIAFAVPLAIWLLLNSPGVLRRLFWLGCTGLLLAGMTRTESRSGLVVLLISLAIGLYHYRVHLALLRPRHLGVLMLAMAVALPAAVAVMPARYMERIQSLAVLKSGVNAHEDDSLGRRASYIVVGGKMIRDNPLLGSGPGTFPLHYATTGYAKAFSANRKVTDLYRRAHNTYLELFSEIGIPGGLLFVGMIAVALRNLWAARAAWLRQHDVMRTDLLTHLSMSLLSLGLFLMFLSAPNHKYLWIMLGLTWVLRRHAETGGQPEPRS